jgi:hypothetical protein
VRFLEIGHPLQINQALQHDAFHVFHLSGHGGPGCIELEDDDGAPVLVNARELAQELQAAHRNVPLVFLSSCFGATPGAEAGAMATELVRAGVPFEVAMQAGVTDRYGSALAHADLVETLRNCLTAWLQAPALKLHSTEPKRSALAGR